MIEETMIIRRDRRAVYRTFWSLSAWRDILSSVVDVAIIVESSERQEYSMTVAKAGGAQTIRGVRFGEVDHAITVEQPEPPPGFRSMSGVWSFEALDEDVTLVRAKRSFELLPGGISGEEAAQALRSSLRDNLREFKEALEGGYTAA